MSANKYTLEKHIPVKAEGKEVNTMTLSVFYSLGGVNYFTYKAERRGYYISIQPETRSRGMVKMTAFTGYKKLIQPANRFSKAKLDSLAEEGFRQAKQMWEELLPEFKEVQL